MRHTCNPLFNLPRIILCAVLTFLESVWQADVTMQKTNVAAITITHCDRSMMSTVETSASPARSVQTHFSRQAKSNAHFNVLQNVRGGKRHLSEKSSAILPPPTRRSWPAPCAAVPLWCIKIMTCEISQFPVSAMSRGAL